MNKTREEYRKKRVKRIKRIIITLCITLLVLPTIISIFLMFKIYSLESQIEKITEEKAQELVTEPEDKTASGAAVVEAPQKADTASPVAVQAVSKRVYLTFDDGPGTQTEKILDILKEEKVKATFFVLGKEDEYSKKIYKRIVKEGHTLGMHSYSHRYDEIYSSKEKFREDTEKEYQFLHSITGEYPKFYRFPGGSRSEMMEIPFEDLADVLKQYDLSYIDWNIISMDAVNSKASAQEITRGIVEAAAEYDSSVVLMYDTAEKITTSKALPALIKELKEKNYELLPVDEETPLIRHKE